MKLKNTLMASIISTVFLLSIGGSAVSADSSVSLQVNEKPFVAISDVPAPYVNHDGRTMVPLRFISENLGASVTWNGETNQAMIQKGDTTIYVTVGLNQIVVNGSNVDMDTTPKTQGAACLSRRGMSRKL